MISLLKYLTLTMLITLAVSCSNQIEVLKAKLQFDGTCCSGELILYDNYTFKISYSTYSDYWGSSIKGSYRIEGNSVILDSGELLRSSNNLTITKVGDLFTNRYQFNFNSLVPIIEGFSKVEIENKDQKFFRIPAGFEQIKNQGAYEMYLFNFSDSLLRLDTINIYSNLNDPLPYIKSCNVKLILPEHVKLIQVNRFVNIYPTIWSKDSDGLTQFMQLNNLVYQSKRSLICKETTFYYPEIEISESILKNFDRISQTELREAVNEELKNDNINARDKGKWLGYVNLFKDKDFSIQNSDMFRVKHHEIYLVVHLKINGNIIKKVLRTKRYYGN